MKILGLHILKPKTLEAILKKTKHDVLVVPNKMISRLLAKHAERPMVKQAVERVVLLKSTCDYLMKNK